MIFIESVKQERWEVGKLEKIKTCEKKKKLYYGLPNIYKLGIPIIRIISHKLTDTLSKIVTLLLGTIISSHIKNLW